MININFKSNIDFSNDLEYLPTSEWQVFKIDGRLVPAFVQPASIEDTWDGDQEVVMQTIWDHWFFEINMSSAQMRMLSIILTCKDITIEDTVYNIPPTTLDTSSSEYNIYEVSELLGQTSNYKVTARLRSNPFYINQKVATENINYIKVNSTFYYNDNVIIQRVVDSNFNQFEDNAGLKATTSSDFKEVLMFVYYYNATNRNALKEDFEGNKPANITCFNGTLFTLLENTVIENEEIGKDFYRMVVTCVIDADRKYLLV